MPRPRKRRNLGRLPRPAIYKPAGIPLDGLNQVRLLQEELEALRLADLEALTQVEAAQQMGVSRSTFQRILSRARRQVALALCEGNALKIAGVEIESTGPSAATPENRKQMRRH
jgi:predicted DNA-binding protein (UPF0251 family)